MKRVAFHAGADAAREVARHPLVLAGDALTDRHHVAGAAVFGIDRPEDVVEQRALVEVGVGGVGLHREEQPRHLEHVVDVAGLGRAALDYAVELAGFAEVLVAPVAAGREAVVPRHLVPEEPGRHAVRLVPRVEVAHERPEQFRHLRVAVLAGEDVLTPRERVDDRAVREPVRKRQPPAVAGVGIEVGRHLVHPAELGVQHPLKLRVAQPGQDALGPCGVLDLDVQRRPVAREAVGVPQPGVDLVEHIPGRPEAVQVEAARVDGALRERLVERLRRHAVPVELRADVPVAVRVLDGLQLAHQVIRPRLESRVARRCPHQADRRQVVPGDVARQLTAAAVPAAVPVGLRLEARGLAQERHHAIRLERQQVLRVEILRALERPAGQPDVAKRQRARLRRHHHLRRRGRRRGALRRLSSLPREGLAGGLRCRGKAKHRKEGPDGLHLALLPNGHLVFATSLAAFPGLPARRAPSCRSGPASAASRPARSAARASRAPRRPGSP